MQFSFTSEQLALRDAVRDLLSRECPPSAVRAAWTNETGRVPGLWKKLAEAGVIGLLAPEEHGGMGLTEVDLVLVLEETGRACAPEPVVEMAAVAVPFLREVQGAEDLIGEVISGQTTFAFRIANSLVAAPTFAKHQPDLAASSPGVIGSPGVFRTLVSTNHAVHLISHGDLDATQIQSVDGSRRVYSESLNHKEVLTLGRFRAATDVFDRGALGTSAQLLGIAQHLIDVTVAYVKVREQFKQPVGAFQAVKHHLADAFIKLDFARPLVYRAAWSVAHADPERSIHVSMAKSAASDAALFAARQALQCHGAIGYSFEYDLHLWMKRAWALAAAWGDSAWHRARIASAILDRQ